MPILSTCRPTMYPVSSLSHMGGCICTCIYVQVCVLCVYMFCVYMCICVYVCPCVYMCSYVHMYAFVCVIYGWVNICMHVHACVCVYIYVVCPHVYGDIYPDISPRRLHFSPTLLQL